MTSTSYFKWLLKCVFAVAFYYIAVTSAAVYNTVAAIATCEQCLTIVRTVRTVVWIEALEIPCVYEPGYTFGYWNKL